MRATPYNACDVSTVLWKLLDVELQRSTSKGGVQICEHSTHAHETMDDTAQIKSVTAVHITCHVDMFLTLSCEALRFKIR